MNTFIRSRREILRRLPLATPVAWFVNSSPARRFGIARAARPQPFCALDPNIP
jgi:hypothetical protein